MKTITSTITFPVDIYESSTKNDLLQVYNTEKALHIEGCLRLAQHHNQRPLVGESGTISSDGQKIYQKFFLIVDETKPFPIKSMIFFDNDVFSYDFTDLLEGAA